MVLLKPGQDNVNNQSVTWICWTSLLFCSSCCQAHRLMFDLGKPRTHSIVYSKANMDLRCASEQWRTQLHSLGDVPSAHSDVGYQGEQFPPQQSTGVPLCMYCIINLPITAKYHGGCDATEQHVLAGGS